MTSAWAIIYGILQGLTEFLPISSSGHLALMPFFFEIKDPGVLFDLMMHLGTALAIAVYFFQDIKDLSKGVAEFVLFKKRDEHAAYAFNFSVATITTVVFILLVKDFALEYGRTPKFIAFNLAFFGVILFISDRFGSQGTDLTKKMDWKRSALIGFSQMLAIFPGVSRSGITITSARFSGLTRVNASRFSFLLSLPIIFASVVYKLKGTFSGEEVLNFNLVHMGIGIAVSFIIGLLTIHFFLKLLARVGFSIYAIYRIFLAIAIVVLINS